MQPSALRALEFDRIVEAVRDYALTPMGAERLAGLQPSTDASIVAGLLAATSETTRYIAAHGLFPLRASSEFPQILSALAVEGRALEASGSSRWRPFSIRDESRAGIRRAPGSSPVSSRQRRCRVVQGRVGADAREDRIRPATSSTTPARAEVDSREAAEAADAPAQHARVVLRGKETANTCRTRSSPNATGRYVLLVKAEHRGGIPVIVHGTSASGASRFLEPLTPSRSQRHRSGSRKGERGSQAHPARADRRVPGRGNDLQRG